MNDPAIVQQGAVPAPPLPPTGGLRVTGAWLGMAYIVLFATVIAYAANTWAVRRSSPALVAAYSTLQPLVAAGLAAAFLGESFGWVEGVGFALIMAGLWQVSAQGQRT